MSVASILPPAVRTYVHDFDARARRLALVRAVGVALTVLIAWTLLWCALDRVLQLPAMVRLGALAGGIVAATVIVYRPARVALRKRIRWVDAAERIEQHNPQFGQRLVTITSRVLGPAEHRGSDDMLRELLRDVDRQAAGQDPAKLLPFRRAAVPWLFVVVLSLLASALVRVPEFGLPTLATRLALPFIDIRPVTTTQLEVPTGSRDVVQAQPLRIDADVARLPQNGIVSLFVSDDGGTKWARMSMGLLADARSAGSDRFAFTLGSVDRDVRYYITAGDATSRTYTVRVRRPPAVERFTVRYEYPAYTARAPLTVSNADGLIEAPVGTRVILTMTATEPLDNALLAVTGDKLLMERVDAATAKELGASDANRVRRASFVVRRNSRYTLDLISDRQVPGEGPAGTMLIRALPDGKPLVRLPQAGESLRLHPREILPVSYQALDDYGIGSLSLTAQVNTDPPVEVPIRLTGDSRRQEREYDLDLATMPLSKPLVIGDVITLVLTATDRAGQKSGSEPLEVLVSPRSVDVATYQRVAELNAAAALAANLNEHLTQASAALAEADKEAEKQPDTRSIAFLAAINRANRQLTGASESAAMIRQALFRVIVNSRSTGLSNAAANWIDEAQVQLWQAEDLFRRSDVPAGMGTESRGMLARSLETTRTLRDEIKSVAAGERAAAVLADRENLLASQKRAESSEQTPETKQRLERTLARAREDIAAGAKELGLDPAAPDLDAQLKARSDTAANLLKSEIPVDFATAAREWAQALHRDRTQPVVLDERLSSAAHAEAVRHDADMIRARDLLLASRAAVRLERYAQSDPTGRSLAPVTLDEYAGAVAAIQREHARLRVAQATTTPSTNPAAIADATASRAAATQARAALDGWSQDAGSWFTSGNSAPDVEELAFRAGAETAARNYGAAAELDAQLARQLAAAPVPLTTTPSTMPGLPATSTTQVATSSPSSLPSTIPVGPIVAVVDGPAGERHKEIAHAVRRAEALDRIGEDQQRLTSETTDGESDTRPTAELIDDQREVAEAIERIDGNQAIASGTVSSPGVSPNNDPNWRGRATKAVLAAQESMAALPQQIALVQEALGPWRDALVRAEQSRKEAGAMPDPVRQPAAERAALQAERDAADAGQRFQDRRKPIAPSVADALAATIEPFAPETSSALEAVGRVLQPALRRLAEASDARDADAFARAADEARRAIETVQRELSVAQDALSAHDPLVAAKWNARTAADLLSQNPPDVRMAQARQREVSTALSRALDRTIHDAAAMRIASLPAFESIYAPAAPAPRTQNSATTSSPGGTSNVAATDPAQAARAAAEAVLAPMRNWSRLRPRESQALDAAHRESDAPGFEEPLRLYFEALGKGRTDQPPG